MSETKSPEQKLVAMANQISDYFRTFPAAEAAPGVADHIGKFWAPKMRGQLIAFAERGGAGLDPLSTAALALVKAKDAARKVA